MSDDSSSSPILLSIAAPAWTFVKHGWVTRNAHMYVTWHECEPMPGENGTWSSNGIKCPISDNVRQMLFLKESDMPKWSDDWTMNKFKA